MIDVTGKLPQANEMLKKVTAAQLKRGAKRSEVKVKGCPDVVIQFDLPELEEEKEAGKSTLRAARSRRPRRPKRRQAAPPSKAAAGGRAAK